MLEVMLLEEEEKLAPLLELLEEKELIKSLPRTMFTSSPTALAEKPKLLNSTV